MGFVGNLFSGSRGMGWNASGTDIQQPATMEQAQTAYGNAQTGLAGQQAFLQALQGQNAIQRQTGLTGTLESMVAGGGPNPALTQFNRALGQTLGGTNAAITGARGGAANPAAVARTAARTGADIGMKAATDAATLRQTQQLNAINALGTQLGGQVTNLGGAANAYSTAAQNEQQQIYNAINAANQARVAMQSNINNANAGIQGITAQGQQGIIGGILGGAGSALQLPMKAAHGGEISHSRAMHQQKARLAEGGDPMNAPVAKKQEPQQNFFSGFEEGMHGGDTKNVNPLESGLTKFGAGIGSRIHYKTPGSTSTMPGSTMQEYKNLPEYGNRMTDYQSLSDQPVIQKAGGGKVPAMVSPGEKYLTPHQAQNVLKGKENPLNGKTIPGKAKVKGDSYDNDTVPVTLEEGGCVIPRSVLQSDQPMKNAIKFVHEHMKKMAKGGKVEHKDKKEVSPELAINPTVHPQVAIEVLRKPHFLFSPAKPRFEVTNHMTPDEVLQHLNERGYTAEPALGKYGEEEPSIMVHNITEKHLPHLLKLAEQLGQEAAIYSKEGEHEAHFLHGPKKGMISYGRGTDVFEKEPKDFYTKTKNGLIFSHQGIDFDNPEPPRRK